MRMYYSVCFSVTNNKQMLKSCLVWYCVIMYDSELLNRDGKLMKMENGSRVRLWADVLRAVTKNVPRAIKIKVFSNIG